MTTYSMDLRERAVKAVEKEGLTKVEAAKRFGVTDRWIRSLLQRKRETGSIAPKPHGGGMPLKLSEAQMERLRGLVDKDPGATLAELRKRMRVSCCMMTISRALERLGFTRKKSRYVRLSKIDPM